MAKAQKKIKAGVVGMGGMGQSHMRALQAIEGVEVVAICDILEERVKDLCKEHKVKHGFTDWEEFVSADGLDAICIATGNALHAPIGVAAAERGIHVITEKPMAMSTAEAQSMVDAAEKAGTYMMCGFNNRFRPEVQHVVQMVERGDLGEIYYAKTNWLRRLGFPRGWFVRKKDAGGGPLIDLGVHVIDVAHYMMGRPKPVSVFGQTWDFIAKKKTNLHKHYEGVAGYEGLDVEDMAVALIRFENGAIMNVEASWAGYSTPGDEVNHEIIGTEGSAMLRHGSKLQIHRELDGTMYTLSPDRLPPSGEKIAHFIACIRGEEEPMIANEDGLFIQKILDGIYASAEKGGEVIL